MKKWSRAELDLNLLQRTRELKYFNFGYHDGFRDKERGVKIKVRTSDYGKFYVEGYKLGLEDAKPLKKAK